MGRDVDMNYLSLFSGIGGMDLGLDRAGWTCVAQVEIDPFCRAVLARHWPEVPRHDDVRTCVEWWRAEPRPAVDAVVGGFPCQPVSTAGQRKAQQDPRWLWPAAYSVIRDLRPRWVVLENVAGLLSRGMGDVLGDLAACGYDAQWDCLPAAAFGAPHRRDRIFVVAYPEGDGCGKRRQGRLANDGPARPAQPPAGLAHHDVAYANGAGPSWGAGGTSGQPCQAWRVEPERLGYILAGHRPVTRGHWASESNDPQLVGGCVMAGKVFRLLGVDEWPVLVGPYWVGEPVTARADETGRAYYYYRIELPLRMTAESVIVTGPDDGPQVTIDPH